MSNEKSDAQPRVNEAQTVPGMQKAPQSVSLEKGQSVPPMQARPQVVTVPPTSGSANSESSQNSGNSDSK